MRLPWNKKQEINKIADAAIGEDRQETKPVWWEKWIMIQELYPIGLEFKLLDNTILVHKYTNFSFRGEYTPSIACLYFDKNGVINHITFDFEDWDLLKELRNRIPEKKEVKRTKAMIS